MVLAVVFSAAFGTVLAAAGDTIPSELSDRQKQVLQFAFCQKMDCNVYRYGTDMAKKAQCSGVDMDQLRPDIYETTQRTWSFLIDEMVDRLKWNQEYHEPYVQAFLKDLEISFALDDFRFTKEHALNCIADLKQMFKDDYTPTFNIELLK